MHLNSRLLFNTYARNYFDNNQSVLEIGPSGYPSEYQKSVSNESIKWQTLDIDDKFIGNASENSNHIKSENLYTYPIKDGTYDIVVAGQVIEHISNIWEWLSELKRILKKNGKLIIICPVSWPYHEAPIDSWRIYPDGMKALAEKVDLNILLAQFKSYEKDIIPRSTPTYPGSSSINLQGNLSKSDTFKIGANKILNLIPLLHSLRWPISVSYDCIAIFSK